MPSTTTPRAGAGRTAMPLSGEIELDRFVALSPGLGLGEPRPKRAREPQKPTKAKAGASAAAESALWSGAAASAVTEGDARGGARRAGASVAASETAEVAWTGAAAFSPDPKAPPAPRPAGLSIAARIVAWSLDFVFVVTTLAMALACAAAWSVASTGDVPADWYALPALQWLASFEVWEVVAGVYGIFLAYALLFKLVVGRTCGESALRLVRKARA